jgi:class 3 adenylate cyclase
MRYVKAERRQISAMSCEAMGVAARADGIGLEDLLEATGAFQHCVSEIVGHHSGFIASRLGNTVLVLFGYPAAREHDAEQAIRTGLELCAAVKALRPDTALPMRCRIGIATGMVIIGDPVGGCVLPDRAIVGEVPNLAARLMASAQPDTVAIDRVSRRLIGGLFDCRGLGTLETNTESEPICRWQVVVSQSVAASHLDALRIEIDPAGWPRRRDRPVAPPVGARQGGRGSDHTGLGRGGPRQVAHHRGI